MTTWKTVVVEVIKVDQFDTGTITEFFEEGGPDHRCREAA